MRFTRLLLAIALAAIVNLASAATFTGTGTSTELLLTPGNDLSLSVTGTFSAVIELQVAVGQSAWSLVRRITGTDVVVLDVPAGRYRLVCTSYTSGTATYALTASAEASSSSASAVNVSFTPAGNIAATTVQAALEELDSEKLATVAAASDTVAGTVELATAAETTTGTDATRAVTPDGLAGSEYGMRGYQIEVTDPNGNAITTGDGKAYLRIPTLLNGWNLVRVGAHVTTVSSSGIPTIQLRNVTHSVDMLSTKLTIDANEKDSSTAATAAVIDVAHDDVVTGDEIAIDIDVAGTGAKGLLVDLIFQLP